MLSGTHPHYKSTIVHSLCHCCAFKLRPQSCGSRFFMNTGHKRSTPKHLPNSGCCSINRETASHGIAQQFPAVCHTLESRLQPETHSTRTQPSILHSHPAPATKGDEAPLAKMDDGYHPQSSTLADPLACSSTRISFFRA